MNRHFQPKKFNPHPFEYRQEIELDIVDINNHGMGIGRIDGWVVSVAYALAGERVKAAVFRNHKNYSEADLLEILKPSPERVEPVCKLFGECGGCQYQHLNYASQLKWKQNQVEQLMKRIGALDIKVEPTHASPTQYAYRSKLTPHYEKPNARGMPIGFVRQGRRTELVDVEHCPIASKNINAALPGARAKVLASADKLKRGGTILLRDCLEGVIEDNNAFASEKVGHLTLQFSAGEFFQNNPFILPELLDYAISEASGAKYLVDAYCGVGVFSLWGSRFFERSVGIEISAKSIQCANMNMKINAINNCEFFIGKAENIFSDIKFSGADTAMIIDPPRSGCDELFISQLLNFAPQKIVYVSCGPDTQARDLNLLVKGGYNVVKLTPFDMFPQTRHIESVATLVKS